MKIAGDANDKYGKRVLAAVSSSPFRNDIEYVGRVSIAQKAALMRQSHLILVTSVKEGWGLTVTEANGQGTPAVVYDVDGLRDSVRPGETGYITKECTPRALARTIVSALNDRDEYARIRKNAWTWARQLTMENCYRTFLEQDTPKMCGKGTAPLMRGDFKK